MELKLDFDRPAPFAAGKRQPVEQVDTRDEVERVGKCSLDDLGLDRSLAEHDGGRVPVESVSDQQTLIDIIHRDWRQAFPGVGVALDSEVVEAIAQVQILVKNQIVEWYVANLHRGRSFVVDEKAPSVRARESGC